MPNSAELSRLARVAVDSLNRMGQKEEYTTSDKQRAADAKQVLSKFAESLGCSLEHVFCMLNGGCTAYPILNRALPAKQEA